MREVGREEEFENRRFSDWSMEGRKETHLSRQDFTTCQS